MRLLDHKAISNMTWYAANEEEIELGGMQETHLSQSSHPRLLSLEAQSWGGPCIDFCFVFCFSLVLGRPCRSVCRLDLGADLMQYFLFMSYTCQVGLALAQEVCGTLFSKENGCEEKAAPSLGNLLPRTSLHLLLFVTSHCLPRLMCC